MIHSAADSVAVQFDWEIAVQKWKKRAELTYNFTCRFKNKREVWESFL